MKPDNIAKIIADILEDKKAKDIRIIDIKELSTLADYFVIASGTSVTNIKMLSDEVEKRMEEENVKLLHREGYNSARWILLDYGGVVVHIFMKKTGIFIILKDCGRMV